MLFLKDMKKLRSKCRVHRKLIIKFKNVKKGHVKVVQFKKRSPQVKTSLKGF